MIDLEKNHKGTVNNTKESKSRYKIILKSKLY